MDNTAAFLAVQLSLLFFAFCLGGFAARKLDQMYARHTKETQHQYEILTAYVRLRVLPYLYHSEARTIPKVVERVLRNIDVARGATVTAQQEQDWASILTYLIEHDAKDEQAGVRV